MPIKIQIMANFEEVHVQKKIKTNETTRSFCNGVNISLQSMEDSAAGAPGARAPSRAEEEHRRG